MATKAGIKQLIGSKLLVHLVLIVAALIMLYPILWMLGSTFKPQNEIFTNANLWPKAFVGFKNYAKGWAGVDGHSFGRFFLNSFTIAVGAVVGNVLAGSMAAYAFARLNFRFRRVCFAVMLLTIMLPYHAVLIPQYVLFFKLVWVNTFLPLIVPKLLATDAFFIFLMVQFIRGIPRELDDAARVDGCGYVAIYWRILLPLMTPALVTTAIFTFIWTWDDFFSQLIYLSDPSKYTVTLGLQAFLDATHESSWGAMFAMSILSLLPILLIFLGFQRLLVEGIATTGIKR
jgi:multiple sugar transport system permease protein